MSKARRSAIVLIAAMSVIAAVAVSVGAAPASPRLAGAVPSWARQSNFVRHASSSQRVDFAVALGWRNAAGVASLARAVSNPKSSSYGHYLTAAQFRARFAPSAADASKVQSWLRGHGFSLGRSPLSHLWVAASGTVSQVERAFGVHLNVYRTHTGLIRGPDSAPAVPASLASVVHGIFGLARTTSKPATVGDAPPPAAFVQGRPCSSFWGQKAADTKPPAYGSIRPYAPCGYTPQQLRSAYGVAPLVNDRVDGRGVSVAVVDAFHAKTISADLRQYSKLHNLPSPSLTQNVVPTTPGSDPGDEQGWYGEETLDLEAIHSMAPRAALVYQGAADDQDLNILERVSDVLDNNRASIISNSYGNPAGDQLLPPDEIATTEAVYEQAVVQGVGVYFSSGDCGDELDPAGLCGGAGIQSADYPASSPNVTAVGGTSLAVGDGRKYDFETGWGTTTSSLVSGAWSPTPPGSFLYGSGGGTSKIFAEPSYQKGVVPTSLSGFWGGKNRVEPDLAAVGDPNTGFLIGETQTFPDGSVRYSEYRIGGTSLSCPLVAGIMAIATQKAGHALGFINPALYALAGTNDLRDIVNPSSTVAVVRTNYNNGVDNTDGKSFRLRTMNQTGTLATTPGYDNVTGLGTPNGKRFIDGISGT